MITDGLIRSAITSCTRGKQQHITLKDPGERGGGRLMLLVRANKGGASAEWYVAWQGDLVRKSTKIGSDPAMTLEEARAEFRENYQPALLEGRDPLGPRAWRRKGVAPTIEEMFEAYVANLDRKGKTGAACFRGLLVGVGGLAQTIGRSKPASEVTADDIMPHLQAIFDRGKNDYAERVRAVARAAFQWALRSRNDVSAGGAGSVDWGLRGNPVDAITRIQRNPPRDRVLSPMEFRNLWEWLEERGRFRRYHHLARAIQLMMATGQRPGEILAITAEHYDPVEMTLYWRKTKNGRSHLIPICRHAKVILDAARPNEHGIYFPRQRIADEPAIVDSAAALIEQYIRQTGAKAFQMRDLRRTWKSLAGDAAISKEACDRLQNHAYRDVAAIHYDRSDHLAIKWHAVEYWTKVMDYILYAEGPVTRHALGRNQSILQLRARLVSDED